VGHCHLTGLPGAGQGPDCGSVRVLGCLGGSLAGTTIVGSHELIEAATDPNGLAWGTGGDEAADLCEGGSPGLGSFDNGRYLFAAYWSNTDGGCVAPGNGATFATVPNVLSRTFAQAATTLQAVGFHVTSSYVPDPTCESVGLVVGEQPAAGALTLAGSYVTVKIAQAPRNGCL
jgi:hypothetical protein